MKKIFTNLLLLSAVQIASAQFTFTDDFESYPVGGYIGQISPSWTTWSGTVGGPEDVQATNVLAHGGSNSVYYSSVAASGGPTDCVLPFGGQFTTGTFVFDAWMYVNSGKSAYFNFQQNVTLGQVWNSDWTFKNTGSLTITNQSGLNYSTTFPQGAWFHLIITANLNNSEWNINMDGADMGTFHNTSLGVAAIDIYPLNGDQFYIDDLSITHTPATPTVNNIAVSYLTIPGGLSGSQVNIKALLRNIGSGTIANPYVSLYHNGTLVGNQTFTGMNLAAMDTQIVTLSNQVTYTASNVISADAQVAAGTADDDDTNNDTIIYSYSAIVPAAGKLVVGEEATGTWCQWCPRGAVFMESLTTTYAGFFQGIAVHNADPMTNTVYDAGMGTLITGYPSALVDRLTHIDPSAMEADFISRIQIAPKANIVNGAQWNAGNDTLFVSLTTTFAQAVASGNYKVACVLVEDNVTGSGSGYNQVNAYAGGGQGVMGGFESLSNPVPAAQMEYDFVARAIAPSFTGLPNAYNLPASIGYAQTHNFAFYVPAAWSRPDMKIVGLFIDGTGKIDNASSTTITQAEANGFTAGLETVEPVTQVALYPNPTTSITNLNFTLSNETEVVVNIYTIDGKLVSNRNYGPLNGTQNIEINTFDWSKGIYLVEVRSGKSSTMTKLCVQ
jgi:hypothetical protein